MSYHIRNWANHNLFMSWNSRNNRISIKWVNHNSIDLTYLSLKKTTFFVGFFQHIPLCFYSNFDQESLLDAEFDSASNEYPQCILLMDPATPKTRNTWKTWWWTPLPQKQEIPEKCDDDSSRFSGISFFLGSEVHQKYAVWVLVGCGI